MRFIVFVLFLIVVPRVQAATITVEQGQSIRLAIDSAQNGDTVSIRTGTYDERISISSSDLTVYANGKVKTKAVTVTGSRNTIRGFTISDPTANAGITVKGNNNLFENNEIFHTKQDGVWFFGTGNIFRGNYIHDILDPSVAGDPHVDCFQTWGWDWDTYNVLFEKNTCDHTRSTGSNQMVMLERGTAAQVRDIIFRNNIFIMHDAGYSPMNFHRKSGQGEISGIQVLNNTFYNTTNAGQAAIRMGNITNGRVVNNVSIGYGTLTDVTGGNVTQTGNVQSGNYGMVDYRQKNFRLTAYSPLIDAGANTGVPDDFDGISRPRGAGYDIGAFEYAESPQSFQTADYYKDGKITIIDFVLFMNYWFTNNTAKGDLNGDGKLSATDYTVFMNVWHNYARR